MDMTTSKKSPGKKLNIIPPLPILDGGLSKTEPPKTDYSKKTDSEILSSYSAENYNDYFSERGFLIEHEMLCFSNDQFFFLRGNTARGKSEVICTYTLNETLKDYSHAIVISHNRGVVEELKEKFSKYMRILGDNRQIVAYHGDTEEENKQIRDKVKEEKDQVAAFIITPFMLLGSFTSCSLMGCIDHQDTLDQLGDRTIWGEVFSSPNPLWAKKLSSPSIIVIDEVDSFPQQALLCISIFVRLLISKNPDIKVILSSATVSNPDLFATLFFGPRSDYLDLTGLGRRGKTKMNVFYEEKSEELLEYYINAVKDYIQTERQKVRPGNKYVPQKVILFLNNKRKIDIKKFIGKLSKYFVTVHGDMRSKKVAKRIREFRNNRLQICLVSTSIIQAGLDVPDACWVIFYGIPQNGRDYLQQRGRANRNPKQKGKIDIILRATNRFERDKAADIEDLAKFIFQETSPPYQTPLYTPLTLQYAIVIGVVTGFWNILDLLKDNFYGNNDPNFLQEVELAYIRLLQKGVVSVGSDEVIIPTQKTKKWIHNFSKRFSREIYKVVLRKEKSKDKKIGKISLSELFRRGLPSQTLVYIDDAYEVEEIDPSTNTVFVIQGFLDLYDIENKVEKSSTITEIFAHDLDRDIALVEVIETEEVDINNIDTRTETFDPEKVPLTQSTRFDSMFLKTKITLTVEKQIREICDLLNIDRSVFKSTTCYHEELGLGTLLIDKSKLGLVSMLYRQWINHSSAKENEDTDEESNIETLYQETENRFHKYLAYYYFNAAVIADLHLKGNPIKINGQEVDFRQYCYTLVKPLQNASVIIFLGDTIDRNAAKDFNIAKDQLFILYETLDNLKMLHKTIFIRGNHDYDMRYFRWRKPINTFIESRWPIKPYQDLIFIHGDNAQMKTYLDKQEITKQDVRNWRMNFKKPVKKIKVRIKDFLVSGHLHKGFCDRKQHSLGVPSAKNYWQSPQDEGWVGLFCYCTFDVKWDCFIAIENPYQF